MKVVTWHLTPAGSKIVLLLICPPLNCDCRYKIRMSCQIQICWLIVVWIKEGKLSGFEEITTSFRTYGLDQLWLRSLCFGLRVESLGVANRGFATNFASWRSAPVRIPPGGAYGLHCMPLKDSSILN